MRCGEFLGLLLVAALDLGEMHEEFAHGDVPRLLGGAVVKISRLHLHHLGLAAHAVEVEIGAPPEGPPLEEAAHILAPDRRQVLAEFFAIEPVERIPVLALLQGHGVEEHGRGGKVARSLSAKL